MMKGVPKKKGNAKLVTNSNFTNVHNSVSENTENNRTLTKGGKDSQSHGCEKCFETEKTPVGKRGNSEKAGLKSDVRDTGKTANVACDTSITCREEKTQTQQKRGRKRKSPIASDSSLTMSKRIKRQTNQVGNDIDLPSNPSKDTPKVGKKKGRKRAQNNDTLSKYGPTETRNNVKKSSCRKNKQSGNDLKHEEVETVIFDEELPTLTRVNKNSYQKAENTQRKAEKTQLKAAKTQPKVRHAKQKTDKKQSESAKPRGRKKKAKKSQKDDNSVSSSSTTIKGVPSSPSDNITASSSPIPFPRNINDSDDILASSQPIPLCPESDDLLASSQPIPLQPERSFAMSKKNPRSEMNSEEEITDSIDSGLDIETNIDKMPFLLIDEDSLDRNHAEDTHSENISLFLENSDYLPTPGSPYKRYKYQSTNESVDWSESFTNLDDISLSDSDEELPEVLTPISHGHISNGDKVWIKKFGFPFWPAVVKQRYIKKKRMTVEFINPAPGLPEKHSLGYPCNKVLPFHHSDKEKILKEGYTQTDPERVEYFRQAVDKVTSEIDAKALQSLPQEELDPKCNSFSEFEPINLCDRFLDENSPSTSTVDRKKSSKKQRRKKENKMEDSVIIMGSFINGFEKLRFDKMRKRNMKLVEFCTSDQMKKYLMDIWNGKKGSKRHTIYMGHSTKARDQLQEGFGPIIDEDQMDEIVDVMCEWWRDVHSSKKIIDTNYILKVWVPEGVIYALMKRKGYTRSRAEAMFSKNVSMTKKEMMRMHNSLIEGAKNISEEDKKLYEEKSEDRIRAMMGDNAEDIVKSLRQPVQVKSNIRKYFKRS